MRLRNLNTNPAGFVFALLLAACGGGDQKEGPAVEQTAQDVDGDHIPNLNDNCPNDPNPGQENNDNDSEGDTCDPDDDNDGVGDAGDNCPMIPNLDQADPDRDRLGSACDLDRDGDGVVDYCDFASAPVECIVNDNCLGVWNPRQVDSDRDGTGDACTSDCDRDGVSNFDPGHDESVQDCEELAADFDGDGFRGLNDCREDNAAINIGAVEVCNGIDDDCDDVADEALVNCQPFPLPDGDMDGSPDVVDNCPLVRNEDQADRDNDGTGDLCDDQNEGPPPECIDDADCVDLGETCNEQAGQCVEVCGDLIECDVDEMCVGAECVLRPQPGNDPDDDGVPTRCADEPNPAPGCQDDNCPQVPNPGQQNSDGRPDGGDACDASPFLCANDLDCDPDQECDVGSQECVCLDADNDQTCDAGDNCPGVANPDQADRTGDGQGDACDNGVCGPNWGCGLGEANLGGICVGEQCVCFVNGDCFPGQACNVDPNNAMNNRCESDSDADGIGNSEDLCPDVPDPGQADADGDGLGDACDNDRSCGPNLNPCPQGQACAAGVCACQPGDTDCDGTLDGADTCPQVFNFDQADADNDGMGNACDACPNEAGGLNACGVCGPNPAGLGDACNPGVGACARSGNMICNNAGDGAVCNVGPGQPVAEQCDGIDNDCDGQIDNGVRNACGACGPVPVETCNGQDDDCDGTVDDGFNLGAACTSGVGACARAGTLVCAGNGQAMCNAVPGEPGVESCNGIDDDCDGSVDEAPNGQPLARTCYTAPPPSNNVGLCHSGIQTCANAVYGACVGEVTPVVEVCTNGDDEDCDGVADDGCPAEPDPDGDADGDGVANRLDNCRAVRNADQSDTDGDGLGNVCDAAPDGANFTFTCTLPAGAPAGSWCYVLGLFGGPNGAFNDPNDEWVLKVPAAALCASPWNHGANPPVTFDFTASQRQAGQGETWLGGSVVVVRDPAGNVVPTFLDLDPNHGAPRNWSGNRPAWCNAPN